MKDDMVWSCALPVYKGTARRSHKGHLNVMLMGSQMTKSLLLSNVCLVVLEMTLG